MVVEAQEGPERGKEPSVGKSGRSNITISINLGVGRTDLFWEAGGFLQHRGGKERYRYQVSWPERGGSLISLSFSHVIARTGLLRLERPTQLPSA